VIYTRVDAKKEFMGLTTFAGKQPTLREAEIAPNYLDSIGLLEKRQRKNKKSHRRCAIRDGSNAFL
jgi:hypothetical protein